VIEKLIEGFAGVLECDPGELSEQTEFREHPSWDSLAYLSAIAMIDEEFGVVIPQNEFRGLKTIGCIAGFLAGR